MGVISIDSLVLVTAHKPPFTHMPTYSAHTVY